MVRGKFVSVDVEFCETRKFVICRLVILVAFDPRDLYCAAQFRCELMDKREKVKFTGMLAGGFILREIETLEMAAVLSTIQWNLQRWWRPQYFEMMVTRRRGAAKPPISLRVELARSNGPSTGPEPWNMTIPCLPTIFHPKVPLFSWRPPSVTTSRRRFERRDLQS